MLKQLKEEAQELLDFGNGREKCEGFGMMKIIKIVEDNYNLKTFSINWSVGDFKTKADELKRFNKTLHFDESKFEKVLKLMIKKHDASIGICWDVIQIYLMEHCIKKQKL